MKVLAWFLFIGGVLCALVLVGVATNAIIKAAVSNPTPPSKKLEVTEFDASNAMRAVAVILYNKSVAMQCFPLKK